MPNLRVRSPQGRDYTSYRKHQPPSFTAGIEKHQGSNRFFLLNLQIKTWAVTIQNNYFGDRNFTFYLCLYHGQDDLAGNHFQKGSVTWPRAHQWR
jgi:hypothetical protein